MVLFLASDDRAPCTAQEFIVDAAGLLIRCYSVQYAAIRSEFRDDACDRASTRAMARAWRRWRCRPSTYAARACAPWRSARALAAAGAVAAASTAPAYRRPAALSAACCRRSRIPTRRIAWCPAPASRIYGSAAARDAMHQKLASRTPSSPTPCRCSNGALKAAGRAGGEPGMQPEWFYKGNGGNVVGCGQALAVARLRARSRRRAGNRRPVRHRRRTARRSRLGFAIGNEFSDHVTERAQLSTASRIRSCASAASGPSCAPARCPRTWKARAASAAAARCCGRSPFLTGEANMCHTLRQPRIPPFQVPAAPRAGRRAPAFLRHRDAELRRTASRRRPGDEFEIDLPALGAPLVNPLAIAPRRIRAATASGAL